MAVSVTFYPQSVTWAGGINASKTSGGPIQVRYDHGGSAVGDRTGDADYSMFKQVVNKDCQVVVRLREVKQTFAIGTTTGALSFVLTAKNGASVTITFANMLLESVRGMQGRATPGDVELVFSHESADGSTNPVS